MALRINGWMRWVCGGLMVVSLALSAGGCTAPPSDSTPSPFLRLHDRESPNEPDDDPDGGNSIPIYPAQPPGPPGDPQ